jgi:hypothetical protein
LLFAIEAKGGKRSTTREERPCHSGIILSADDAGESTVMQIDTQCPIRLDAITNAPGKLSPYDANY